MGPIKCFQRVMFLHESQQKSQTIRTGIISQSVAIVIIRDIITVICSAVIQVHVIFLGTIMHNDCIICTVIFTITYDASIACIFIYTVIFLKPLMKAMII